MSRRLVIFLLCDESVVQHGLKDVVSAGFVAFGAHVRRVDRGRLDGRGEAGALHERQLPGVHAEKGARRSLKAVRAAAKVHGIQIHLQNLVLAVLTLDLEGEEDLLKLSPDGLFTAQMRQLGELLGDGARPLDPRTASQVAPERAEDAVHVDAPVCIKAQILCGDERELRMLRNLGQGDERAVFHAAQLTHELAIRVVERGGLRQAVQARRIEPLPVGHVEDDEKRRSGCEQQDDQHRQDDQNPLFPLAHVCCLPAFFAPMIVSHLSFSLNPQIYAQKQAFVCL